LTFGSGGGAASAAGFAVCAPAAISKVATTGMALISMLFIVPRSRLRSVSLEGETVNAMDAGSDCGYIEDH
jgi:hypothetical protein